VKTFFDAFKAALREVGSDRAAQSTFSIAVILYSFYYPAPYRHQVTTDQHVVVIDNDHSAMSRALLRKVVAIRSVWLSASVPTPREARSIIERGDAEAILLVPSDFQRSILRGTRPNVALFVSGVYLGRATNSLNGLNDAISSFAGDVAASQARFAGRPARPALALVQRPLFNTREGYGSAVVPGVVILIVYQTLFIGIALLIGTRKERQADFFLSLPALFGVMAAFAMIGLINLLYYVGFILWLQDYPRHAPIPYLLLAGALFIASTVAFALFVGSFFNRRVRALQVIGLTSLTLLSLSNLTWPVTATPFIVTRFAKLLPTTAGINALIKLNQMGAEMTAALPELTNLAVLTLVYGSLAAWRFRERPAQGP
jgi:ABC-2 type transport system permease protein